MSIEDVKAAEALLAELRRDPVLLGGILQKMSEHLFEAALARDPHHPSLELLDNLLIAVAFVQEGLSDLRASHPDREP